ncbi:glycosyltransferase family 4 protein [Maribacter aquivivus]|uniref:glycosyltransferase family 4 protein n=1 Tax=Maribacter aquivivus TaxID=228958 RepID=UPI002493AA2F|nr:glycosyltransferase [Maribacter aquivivus]
MGSQKKVLVIAYACEPNETSEPGVGWNFVKEISKSYKTTVITRANNRTSIENDGFNAANFSYYDLPGFFKKLKKRMPLGTQLYYFLWQWAVYLKWSKKIKKENLKFDLLHHLNFGITWVTPPAFLFKIPFVWGPIGGGDVIPFRFLKRMQFRAIAQEFIYIIINNLRKLSILSYLTKKKSSAIIFRNESVKKVFLNKKSREGSVVSETATSILELSKNKEIEENLYAICVGRMNYWKGFILAVEGFHCYLSQGGVGTLELFGDGPEKDRIEQYIQSNNLQKHIIIRGVVDNEIILNKMKEANVLIHPSFRDGGSWAIMEAMSNGLPVVCLNASGPKDMVTKNCGLLIDVKSYSQVKMDIGEGLLQLLNDKNKYKQLSNNAITRIDKEYNWNKRGNQIKEIYESVLETI